MVGTSQLLGESQQGVSPSRTVSPLRVATSQQPAALWEASEARCAEGRAGTAVHSLPLCILFFFLKYFTSSVLLDIMNHVYFRTFS